jgi:hypothetical protein
MPKLPLFSGFGIFSIDIYQDSLVGGSAYRTGTIYTVQHTYKEHSVREDITRLKLHSHYDQCTELL